MAAFFCGLIFLATFPLFLKAARYLPGFFSTDESYAICWNAWFNRLAFLNNYSLKFTDYIAYPFGVEFYKNSPVVYAWILVNYVFAVLTTPVLTYNFQIFINFLLNAFLTYLLVVRLTKNILAGVFSGVIFGFCPYIFMRSWQHLGETYLWMMPMLLFSIFALQKEGFLRLKVIFILSLVFTTLNGNAFLYMPLLLLTFFIFSSVRILADKFIRKSDPAHVGPQIKLLVQLLLLVAAAVILLLPQIYPIIRNSVLHKATTPDVWNVYNRPFEDLFTQSARPLSYFLPSSVHPVFGKFTQYLVGNKLYGISFTEHTLYLGWIPLLLSFVALRRWIKNRKSRTYPDGDLNLRDNENYYLGFFILLAVLAWFCSQPPWWNIFGFRIYMPSFFIYKVIPVFRAYCRFGIVVMLAVAVLAGFGLKFLLERFKRRISRIAVAVLFCVLVLFEFWSWPPFKVIDVSNFPAVYSWLKEQPRDIIIAEYPLDSGSPNEMYKLYQIKHEKRMINGTIPGSKAHKFAQQITKLSSAYTAGVLKWMGVKYVLVHKDGYLRTDLVEDIRELSLIPANKGLKLVGSFAAQECPRRDIMCIQATDEIDIYEVVALPVKPEMGGN